MRRIALLLALAAGCDRPKPPPSPAPAEPQRLLSDAGFPGGKGFPKLTILYNTNENHRRVAAAIQEMWRVNLGIEIQLANVDWKVLVDRRDRGDYEIVRHAWIGEYLDPHAFLDLFRRESGTNTTGWSSDEYERLIETAERELDPARRRAPLDAAEEILLREAPIFPIYHYVSHNFIKPFVKGVHPNARDMHPLQGVTLEGPGRPADGVLIFNGSEEPQSLDPALSHDIAGLKILMHLFEGLCAYDPRDASPIPAAAERWEVSPDGLTWTFHLRPARWSNGDPVTAHDFVWAWRRVADPATASPYAHRMFVVKNARAIFRGEAKPETLAARAADDRTLVVELAHAAPWFPELLCLNLFYPVHRPTVEKHGPRWCTQPQIIVHNGPYRLESWKFNDRKHFVKNPAYRDAGGVKLEKFTFLSMRDAGTAFRVYEAGNCHWIFQVPPELLDSLLARPDYLESAYNGVYFYAFNTRVKPLDDARVRRALALSIDRARIAQSIVRGGELPAERLVPPPSRFSK